MPKKIETVHLIIIDYYFRYVETMVLRIARWSMEESTSSVHHFNEPCKLQTILMAVIHTEYIDLLERSLYSMFISLYALCNVLLRPYK